jgi:hypothetical protein
VQWRGRDAVRRGKEEISPVKIDCYAERLWRGANREVGCVVNEGFGLASVRGRGTTGNDRPGQDNHVIGRLSGQWIREQLTRN